MLLLNQRNGGWRRPEDAAFLLSSPLPSHTGLTEQHIFSLMSWQPARDPCWWAGPALGNRGERLAGGSSLVLSNKRYWARYWFKLQNTTLYFYTKGESQVTSLRGQYYMYRVQSVRTVTSSDANFTFEIVMKNGKRKLLSADSEDLRDVWIKLLWKAMQLPGPGHHDSSCTWFDIPEIIQRVSSSSADETMAALSPNKDLKDDVFQEHKGDRSRSGSNDEYDVLQCHLVPPPPHTGEDSSNSSNDEYDFPQPQKQLPALQPGYIYAGEYMSMNQCCVYDTPKPSLLGGDSGDKDGEQYLTMNDLSLYDTPKPRSLGGEVSGVASSSVC